MTLWPPQAVAGVVGALHRHTETNIQKRTYKNEHTKKTSMWGWACRCGILTAPDLWASFNIRLAHGTQKRTFKKDGHVGLGPLLRRSAGAGPGRLAAASSSSGCGIMHAMRQEA